MSPAGHRARKRFGQNFLSDPGILRRLAAAIGAGPGEHLVEIGPGRGALTALLLARGCRLDAIELDRDLVPMLQDEFGADEHFRLHQGDALRFDFAALAGAQPLRVVGNLPYNISTPLLFHLLTQRHCIRDMHFMLQKEVVERLAAVPGTKAWGRLGVMTQYHCRVEPLFEVPPEAFVPSPKVRSAVVKLVPYETPPHPASDIDRLQAVVRTAFNQRRKTLRNALKPVIDAQSLEALGIDPLMRPERLTLAQFVAIANQPVNRQARPEHP